MKKALVTTGITLFVLAAFIASTGPTALVEWLQDEPELAVGAADPKAKDLFNEQSEVVYTDCDLTKPKNPDIENSLKTYKAKNPDNSLRALDAKDKASLKSCELAKIKEKPRQNVKYSGADYDIEIVDTQYVDGHVEVFARAWNPDGTQIGFGVDGTVDIERFIMENPPVLVEDPQGTIVRESTDRFSGVVTVQTYREDPVLAIQQSISHTISVKTQVFPAANIQPGKVGNTTTTVYPNAHVETVSVDGYAGNNTPGTWATLRAAAGNFSSDTATAEGYFGWDPVAGTHQYLYRSIFLFDTSGIPDTDTISSATLSLRGTVKADPSSNAPNLNIYASTPASNTAVANGDYQQVGSTEFSTSISYAAFSTTGYNNFALNASGLAAISKTSVSKFGARNANYDVANVAPATTVNGTTRLGGNYADATGTTNDPKLVIEHTAAAGGSAPLQEEIIYY